MTKLNLSEKSKNYYEENDIYELFSIAEDYPNKIYKYLLPKIKNKTILDLGCGTGKFMQKFHIETTKYYGLDLSNEQLNIAKRKIKDNYAYVIFFDSCNTKIDEEKFIKIKILTFEIKMYELSLHGY